VRMAILYSNQYYVIPGRDQTGFEASKKIYFGENDCFCVGHMRILPSIRQYIIICH